MKLRHMTRTPLAGTGISVSASLGRPLADHITGYIFCCKFKDTAVKHLVSFVSLLFDSLIFSLN